MGAEKVVAVPQGATERIKLSAQEIVDMVEEQLSWLAVASTTDHGIYAADFCRAESVIQLGKYTTATIDVEGVDAWDQSDFMALPTSARIAHNRKQLMEVRELGPRLLPKLGERFRFARLSQCNPDDITNVWCGMDGRLDDADFADKDDRRLVTGLRGVIYRLHSIGLLSQSESDKWTQIGSPFVRGLRCLVFQDVVAFRDGRSASFPLAVPMRNDGRLLELLTGKPLGDEDPVTAEDGLPCDHPWNWEFGSFVASQYLRREKWVVEVSLSRDRTGLGLETDGAGALALVRTLEGQRDRRARRGVLVHWVKEHFRRKRSGGESIVRAHLRGKTELEAGGMWITVWPARTDIERACNGPRFEPEPASGADTGTIAGLMQADHG